MTEPTTSDDKEKVARLRELIPATGAGIYLDTAYRGPLPAETHAAMQEAEDWELRVGRAAEGREEDYAQKKDEARAVIAALIGADPREIALVASDPSWGSLIDPVTGAYLPLAPGDRLVDATLAVGAIPVDVRSLDVESIYFRTDRWLLGPEGTGAIWARRDPRYDPVFTDDHLGRTQILGLARSIGWLEMYVGLEWAFERTARLAARLHAALSATDDVEVVTPADAMAAIVVFRLSTWPTSAALDELRRRVFAILGTTPEGNALRASVAWFNTDDELDHFAAAVAEVARHAPGSLPRRPPLVVR